MQNKGGGGGGEQIWQKQKKIKSGQREEKEKWSIRQSTIKIIIIRGCGTSVILKIINNNDKRNGKTISKKENSWGKKKQHKYKRGRKETLKKEEKTELKTFSNLKKIK